MNSCKVEASLWKNKKKSKKNFDTPYIFYTIPKLSIVIDAGVAQLARASAFQAEGCGFESHHPLH